MHERISATRHESDGLLDHGPAYVNDDPGCLGLPVGGQEVPESPDGLGQIARPRQGDDPQMVRIGPVETATVGNEDLLLHQQIQRHLFIVFAGVYVVIGEGDYIKCVRWVTATRPGKYMPDHYVGTPSFI